MRKNTKKIAAFALAATMLMASSTTAFAAVTENGGSASTNVTGSVKEFIDVDITWGSMTFEYDTQHAEGTTGWSCAADANKVTVTNKSSVGIDAGLAFTSAEVTAPVAEAIVADFKNAASAGTTVTTLPLAVGLVTPTEGTAYLDVTGGKITAATKIGAITVTIAKQ